MSEKEVLLPTKRKFWS